MLWDGLTGMHVDTLEADSSRGEVVGLTVHPIARHIIASAGDALRVWHVAIPSSATVSVGKKGESIEVTREKAHKVCESESE
jgi:uncharacterized Zn finger protein